MQLASFVVSLLAIGIALGSVALARRADKRAEGAEYREQRRERREEAEAAALRQARPVVTPRGGSGGPTADRIQHNYEVRNTGQAAITELWLWIENGEGKAVSTRAGGALVLAAGDPPAHMAIEVIQKPLPKEQSLMVQWRDADGLHTEATGIEPPQHM